MDGQPDEYALVSSFYGPGAIGGWYLTTLGCLLTFTLNTQQRRQNTITADLIAVVAYPCFAAAHLLSQLTAYSESPQSSRERLQSATAIEASLVVTETFLALNPLLFTASACFKAYNRIVLLAITGSFCFAIDSILFFSGPAKDVLEPMLSRRFLMNSKGILIGLLVELLTLDALALILASVASVSRSMKTRNARQGQEEIDSVQSSPSHPRDIPRVTEESRNFLSPLRSKSWTNKSAEWYAVLTLILLPFTAGAPVFPATQDLSERLRSRSFHRLTKTAPDILHKMIPRTNVQVKELDQLAALLAGTTSLGFSVFGVAKCQCQAWKDRRNCHSQQVDVCMSEDDQPTSPDS